MKESNFLTVFCFSDMLANKNQVVPWLSFTNVPALNFLLRSEIFVSEDKQLRAVHLILEFEPISKIFQEIGHTIRAGDPRLARIDISKPDFLSQDDPPPVVLSIQPNPPPLVIPLQQIPPQAATVEEIASSRLSLSEKIDKFHFDEEEGVSEKSVQLSDSETESDRLSTAHPLNLIVAQVTASLKEEEEGMNLKQRTGLKGLLANRNKGSTSKEAPKTQVIINLPPPPP